MKQLFGRCQKHVCFSIRMSSSLLKCSLLMVASVVKNPTMIRVTLLCGRALSGWALWRLLKNFEMQFQDVSALLGYVTCSLVFRPTDKDCPDVFFHLHHGIQLPSIATQQNVSGTDSAIMCLIMGMRWSSGSRTLETSSYLVRAWLLLCTSEKVPTQLAHRHDKSRTKGRKRGGNLLAKNADNKKTHEETQTQHEKQMRNMSLVTSCKLRYSHLLLKTLTDGTRFGRWVTQDSLSADSELSERPLPNSTSETAFPDRSHQGSLQHAEMKASGPSLTGMRLTSGDKHWQALHIWWGPSLCLNAVCWQHRCLQHLLVRLGLMLEGWGIFALLFAHLCCVF